MNVSLLTALDVRERNMSRCARLSTFGPFG